MGILVKLFNNQYFIHFAAMVTESLLQKSWFLQIELFCNFYSFCKFFIQNAFHFYSLQTVPRVIEYENNRKTWYVNQVLLRCWREKGQTIWPREVLCNLHCSVRSKFEFLVGHSSNKIWKNIGITRVVFTLFNQTNPSMKVYGRNCFF